jgi:hypothetical protein
MVSAGRRNSEAISNCHRSFVGLLSQDGVSPLLHAASHRLPDETDVS